MQVNEFAATIKPARTVLLFGAGVSVTSGAPTGAALSDLLSAKLGRPSGDDLSEISQIFENKYGRNELVKLVRQGLEKLEPTAGLLALPHFDWLSIYTTNYDTLIEQSYALQSRNLEIYRSNFDITKPRGAITPLYKIHGCSTQDSDTGHQSRMLITENDYEDYDKYRQVLFNSLKQDMFTADTIIIGQSLNDRHLKTLVKKVAGLRYEGVSSRITLMVHTYDEDRASLFTRLGVEVIHGDLDNLLLAMLNLATARPVTAYSTSTVSDAFLTPDLVITSQDVHHASQLKPDPVRLFNGTPATYADINEGHTIKRAALGRLEDVKNGARGFFLVVSGARGVGKRLWLALIC